MSFLERKIGLQFQLGTGSFGASGFNTVDVPDGLRISAQITKAGGVSMTDLQLRVYGLSLDLMNTLSTLGKPLTDGRNNTVTVTAGDADIGMSTVFVGTIFQAWADMQAAPEGAFVVEAHTGLLDALRPLAPTSIKGYADAAFLISGLAQQMGYTFENSGVSVKLSNPYLHGTGRDQILQLAEAAHINVLFDDTNIAIWPKGGQRNKSAVLISPDTGLVGYPAWTANGLVLMTEFNPSITFGAPVQVQSSITPACGSWTVFKVEHDLETQTPGGKWFTRLEATVLGHTAIS